MRDSKAFDCVRMKNEIQAKLARERRGLSDEEVLDLINHDLETSDSPLAQLWRRIERMESAKKSVP